MSFVAEELVSDEEVNGSRENSCSSDASDTDKTENSLCSVNLSDIEKISSTNKLTLRPPSFIKSPYMNSLDLRSKKSSVDWKTVRRLQLHNNEEGRLKVDIRHGKLTNSSKRANCSVMQLTDFISSTPEYLKDALGMKRLKHSRSTSSAGFVQGSLEFKEKEDMYDEILHLKKTINSQKAESDQMKAKLHHLEQEKSKKDRQIEQLLDPSKDLDYARVLVDTRTATRSIINGLKQKILRLENHCKDKEKALSKLQSDMKTTGMHEMKFTVDTYIEEVQRLQELLKSTEKSNRAERKDSKRQNKSLSATVLKLTKTVNQLGDENQELKKALSQEEMSMMKSPTCRAKGYLEWSKQRLVRRILELEKRIEKISLRLVKESESKISEDKEVESCSQRICVGAEAMVFTNSDEQLRDMAMRHEKENGGLNENQIPKSEIMQLLDNKEESMKDMENVLKEQIGIHERLMQEHKEEMGALILEINGLKKKLEEERTLRSTSPQDPNLELRCSLSSMHSKSAQSSPSPSSSVSVPKRDLELMRRNRAAKIIQTHWRLHRTQDVVLLQSCLRGHVTRQKRLTRQVRADRTFPVEKNPLIPDMHDIREEEVILLQSVFRAHLKRCSQNSERGSISSLDQKVSGFSPASLDNKAQISGLTQREDEDSVNLNPICNDTKFQKPSEEIPKAADSDDSDEIIVSPSKPVWKRTTFQSNFNFNELI